MFGFELWREFKLSIAELNNMIENIDIVYFDKKILIINNDLDINKLNNLWWIIKAFNLIDVTDKNTHDVIFENIDESKVSGKFNYGINTYGLKNNLKDILKISKKVIKEKELNPRFINKDFKNLTSIQIIKEALVKKGTDYNFIFLENKTYFWNTIWVQDIYSYSNRDYGKQTDMNIWMLPPKLAQMMINFASKDKIYDPFVWLWTVLIESVYMWNKEVYGSDLNKTMVSTAYENLEKLKDKFSFTQNIFYQNAKYINEVDILDKVNAIVTEWYLWEIMTKKNICVERIQKQREKLSDLYEWFFSWLQKKWFDWNIVISFPFWEIKWKYFYFEEIYDTINKYCEIQKLLPEWIDLFETKVWSLLYKRSSQLVGREIFKLKLK